MTVTATRSTVITFFGDVNGTELYPANPNLNSPADIVPTTLSAGDNVITVPTGGTVPTCCTIVKPPGNTVVMKLKGIAGDTGISLNLLDPDSISLAPAQSSFVLNAAALLNVRLIWS